MSGYIDKIPYYIKDPTPQARARVTELTRKFNAGIAVNDKVQRHWDRIEAAGHWVRMEKDFI